MSPEVEQLRALLTLKNQVNPHFLFNSLSILASLVETDTKLSVQFINKLVWAYRYTLEQQDHESAVHHPLGGHRSSA